MHRHDGSNGARARAARIRADHDLEATHLDSMGRRSAALEAQETTLHRHSSLAPFAAFVKRIAPSRRRSTGTIGDAPPLTSSAPDVTSV